MITMGDISPLTVARRPSAWRPPDPFDRGPPRGLLLPRGVHDLELVGDPEEAVAVVHEETDLVVPHLQGPRAIPGEGSGADQRGSLDQGLRVVVEEVMAVAAGPRVALLRVLRRSSPGREHAHPV